MSQIAIITARGGSKRIPGKNIKEFCGRPILSYSIEAALESRLFDEIMVSTDDGRIAEVAKKYGAKVPFYRSAATSDDYATTADVLREVLDAYEKRGRTFEWMCCIYPTAPFVTGKRLQEAFQLLKDKQADALQTVVRFSYPPQRGLKVVDGFLQFIRPEFVRTRSQDLEPLYHDAGQFYIWRVSSFAEGIVPRMIPLVLEETEVQDIDDLADWSLAEIKYQWIKKHMKEE